MKRPMHNDTCPVCGDDGPHTDYGDSEWPAHRWPEGFEMTPDGVQEWERRTIGKVVVNTDAA